MCHGDFTTAVLHEYVQLYSITSAPASNNVEFVVGPKLNPTDWDTFANGTEECLGIFLVNDSVPLSYMICDNTLCRAIHPATTVRLVML